MAKDNNNWPVNEEIRVQEMLVIGPNGEHVGVKSKKDALTLATYAGLDLVLISPNSDPPVAKVMNYNKFKYERAKKAKEALKKQKASIADLKEFRLSVTIEEGDIQTKYRQVKKYLEKKDNIKVTIRFKGRQMAHTEIGEEVMLDFAKRLEDVAEIKESPKLEGRTMTMMLVPKK